MASAAAILIVEDDPDIADLLELHLSDMGYRVDVEGDGRDGLERARVGDYALIILDRMLPSMDGMDVCTTLRNDGIPTPILMLTAKSEEMDKVLGLDVGADDYVTKPFSVHELLARVKTDELHLAREHRRADAVIVRDVEHALDVCTALVVDRGARIDVVVQSPAVPVVTFGGAAGDHAEVIGQRDGEVGIGARVEPLERQSGQVA